MKTKKTPTTQKFTQIENVIDSVVIFHGARAASVIEVTATNFALESEAEQQVQIGEYASFLNSLSFPIQILIKSRKLDISTYIKSLETEAEKSKNPLLAEHIISYKQFVENLVKKNTVLDKKFYIVIPFSSFEIGPQGAAAASGKADKKDFEEQAAKSLLSKTQTIAASLKRVNLRFKILEKNDLIKLFYEFYNNDDFQEKELGGYVNNAFVRGKI
jgi:hypothetical protein